MNDVVIQKIASKLTRDVGIREDCVQIGRIVAWKLDGKNHSEAYIRNAIKYRMLSYLISYNTGPWSVSREGEVRYIPLDSLLRRELENDGGSGIQIDTDYVCYPPITNYAVCTW